MIFVMSCKFMSCIFMSCNLTPCNLVRHFHVLHFLTLLLGPTISCPATSCPAFSGNPYICENHLAAVVLSRTPLGSVRPFSRTAPRVRDKNHSHSWRLILAGMHAHTCCKACERIRAPERQHFPLIARGPLWDFRSPLRSRSDDLPLRSLHLEPLRSAARPDLGGCARPLAPAGFLSPHEQLSPTKPLISSFLAWFLISKIDNNTIITPLNT